VGAADGLPAYNAAEQGATLPNVDRVIAAVRLLAAF
jgi:hypothetical protein